MPRRPIKPPSQNTLRFLLGSALTVQQFAKLLLSGRKEPRTCPRCAYRMVEPAGRRWAGRGKPLIVRWRCHGCRSLYESDGMTGPFKSPEKRMA